MAQMRGNIALEGHAPVVSSPAVTVRASRLNTTVTVWRTARMRLTRQIAITLSVQS